MDSETDSEMSERDPVLAAAGEVHTVPFRVAIVGRPNVGKSTLLNRLCGSRVSIVEPTSGVTRDRISVPAGLGPRAAEEGARAHWIEVPDTGGIGIVDRDDLGAAVERQVELALASADLILFVVDVRDGLTPLDREVAGRLRKSEVPVLLVCNKAEDEALHYEADRFRQLGVGGDPIVISAQNGNGVGLLRDQMAEHLDRVGAAGVRPAEPAMKLAVVGRRNAGKSTLINALAGEERMIVSEIPGTTRDAVDVRFERDGEVFVAIDTAGVRKKSRHEDAIEFFGESRSRRTIRRADVVVLLFDVSVELSALDKRLARYVVDHHRPVILAGNKWDQVREYERREFVEYIRAELPGLAFAPVRFLSALEGGGVETLLKTARELYDESRRRVTTGALNRVLSRAMEARAPGKTGARLKVLYATQAEEAPPTFVLFVNDKRLFTKATVRYVENQLRKELDLGGVPLRVVLRDKRDQEQGR
jgi:GTP-binding protein